MARKIRSNFTFDGIEDEILFTRAALKADPDAVDLLPMTDDWLAMLETARPHERTARAAVLEADAQRRVANGRLDGVCVAFSDDLLLAANKDRKSARWTQFFSLAPAQFVRQRLFAQVIAVKGWLGKVGDAVLDAHRPELEKWTAAAAAALDQTGATTIARGEVRLVREQLAEELTRERDGLEEALRARARERGLPREWPRLFFRVEPRRPGEQEDDDAAEPASGAPPAAA